MYDNIGSKIKTLAQVVFIIMAVISIISGVLILFIVNYGFIIGILTAGIGVLLSWVGTFFLYGFGQLIENSDILVREAKKQSNGIQRISTESNENDISTEKVAESMKKLKANRSNTSTNIKRCPHCGERVTSKVCDVCGKENNLF